MSTGTALIRAVLREHCAAERDALAIIEAALLLEVDPLDFCAHRFGLGHELVAERAAGWAGLAYSPVVPATAPGSLQMHRLDALGEVRFVRAELFGREVGFVAPRFEHLVNLVNASRGRPELLANLCLVPAAAIRTELANANADRLLDEARHRLFRRWPWASASVDLPLGARIGFVAIVAALVAVTLAPPAPLVPVTLALMVALVVAPALLRLAAVVLPPHQMEPHDLLDDADLPVYSVLLPLRDEAELVAQLAAGLRALDYPPEKLDIKFIVEDRSPSTITAARAELHDPRFELVVVPDALPRTKPKALDYALPLVRGDLVVIYDAEDIPNRDQLRRAASLFAAEPGIDCLQAHLVIDNAHESVLSAWFAGEYAGQFAVLLPRLASWNLPMPLGGTSNHFRALELRRLGGWDAFNVTEDADLGLRIARFRHRSGVLDSATREEAPIRLGAWMAQRTRWMKGWMQTLIVHNRHPRAFLRDIGWRGFLFVQIYVGSLILAPLLHTAFLLGVTVDAWRGGSWTGSMGWPLIGLLALGYGGAAAIVVAGLARTGQYRLIPIQSLLPLYWLLHSWATLRAAVELVHRPYHWSKTTHGQTRVVRIAAPDAAETDERDRMAAE